MANERTFNTVNDYLIEISNLKDTFFSKTRDGLLKEIKNLNFHYGSESFPVNRSLKQGEIGVSWIEDDKLLAILVEEGKEMWEDTPQNMYILWKDGQLSMSGQPIFKPWQDPEIFCRAMAALQILVPQGKDVIIPVK